MHYGSGYENAFWDDSCFCMTYGDGGTTLNSVTTLADQPEVEHLQVAEAAVDQLARPRGRARGEVPLLEVTSTRS